MLFLTVPGKAWTQGGGQGMGRGSKLTKLQENVEETGVWVGLGVFALTLWKDRSFT